MKKLILIVAIVFSGMLMQAQTKNDTKINIQTNEYSKEVALNDIIDYFIDNDIMFFNVDTNRGVAVSEEFLTITKHNHTTRSKINLRIKEIENGTIIIITGKTINHNTGPDVAIEMINKNKSGWTHVGDVMFWQINKIVKSYPNKTSVTYD